MAETKIVSDRISTTIEFDFKEIGLNDGTVSLPSLAFTSDQSSGLYRIGASDIGFATGGVKALEIDSSQRLSIPAQLSVANAAFKTSLNIGGTGVSAPANIGTTPAAGTVARFQGNSNAVLDIGSNSSSYAWIQSTDQTGLGTSYPLALNPNGSQIYFPDGSAATPSVSFLSDSALGMYRVGASILGFALGGAKRLELNGTAMTWKNAGNHAYFYIDRANTSSEGLVIFSTNGVNSCAIGLDNDTTERLALFTNNDLGTPKIIVDLNGQTQFSSGTGVSVPGISFIGDTNTGIWRSSTATMNFVTGGVNRWQIDSGGTLVSANSGASRLQLGDGTVASPAMQFANNSNTGIYRPALNVFEIAVGGANALGITTSTLQVESGHNITNQDGTVSVPAYSFANDTDTGIYRVGANEVSWACGGTQVFDTNTTGIYPKVQIKTSVNGTATAPSYAFDSFTNTGIFNNGTNSVRVSVNGTQMFSIDTASINLESTTYFQGGSIAAPGLAFATSHNTGISKTGTTQFSLIVAGQSVLDVGTVGVTGYVGLDGSITPNVDNTYSCGGNGTRWTSVWAVNGTIQTSHSSTKTNIQELDWQSLEVPAGVMYDRDGRRWLGYLNDSLPDEARPIENGQILETQNYEQAVIGVLCAVVKGLKEEVKALKAKLGA